MIQVKFNTLIHIIHLSDCSCKFSKRILIDILGGFVRLRCVQFVMVFLYMLVKGFLKYFMTTCQILTRKKNNLIRWRRGDLMVSASDRTRSPCSWQRHFTLTVPLSNSGTVYIGTRKMLEQSDKMPEVGGVEILLVASCYRNRDKLRQLWAPSRLVKTLPRLRLSSPSFFSGIVE